MPVLTSSVDYPLWSETIAAVCQDTLQSGRGQATVYQKVFANPDNPADPPANDDGPSQVFAFQLMLHTVNDVARTIITTARDAAPANVALTAWNALREHYQSQLAANRQRLENDLYSIDLNRFRKQDLSEAEALDEYFSYAKQKRSELTAAGGQLSESDFSRRLRQNLPPEYNVAKMTIAGWDPARDTVERTHRYLRDISDTVRPAPTTRHDGRNNALSLTDFESRRGRGRGRRGRRGRRGGQGGDHQQQQQHRKPQLCYNFARGSCTNDQCQYLHVDGDSILKAAAGLQKLDNAERNTAFQAAESTATRNFMLVARGTNEASTLQEEPQDRGGASQEFSKISTRVTPKNSKIFRGNAKNDPPTLSSVGVLTHRSSNFGAKFSSIGQMATNSSKDLQSDQDSDSDLPMLEEEKYAGAAQCSIGDAGGAGCDR